MNCFWTCGCVLDTAPIVVSVYLNHRFEILNLRAKY